MVCEYDLVSVMRISRWPEKETETESAWYILLHPSLPKNNKIEKYKSKWSA